MPTIYPALVCPGSLGYAAMAEFMVRSELSDIEDSESELYLAEDEVGDLLESLFPGYEEEGMQNIAVSDLILGYAEAFPSPVSHRDILRGELPEWSSKQFDAFIDVERKGRRASYFRSIIRLLSPERMPMAAEDIRRFMEEDYRPLIETVMSKHFAPGMEMIGDLDATLRLLDGLPGTIHRDQLTMELDIPLRDPMNTGLLARLHENGAVLGLPKQLPADVHILPFTAPTLEGLHLFCLALAHAAAEMQGIGWTLLVEPDM